MDLHMRTAKLLTALLTTLAPLGAALAAQPADLFACARALADQDSQNKVGIAPLPSSEKPGALFIPIGREFALLTHGEMSCHRLPKPEVEHAAGSEIQTYAFRMNAAHFKIPKGKLEFAYSTQRDNETRRLTSSKMTKLDQDTEPAVLRRHSCLDPNGAPYIQLIGKLSEAVRNRIGHFNEESAARRDIRRHRGDGPAPAFRPVSEIEIDSVGFDACRKLRNKDLDLTLDHYQRALMYLKRNEAQESIRQRAGSLQ